MAELEAILGDEVNVWKRQYSQRMRLAQSCPTKTSFSYGMRLLQPSSFRGDYAETVRQRFGDTPDFLVLAVAPTGAASRVGIQPGDRIFKIHTVSSDTTDAAKRVATESRQWSMPYQIEFERDGQNRKLRLTPDRLCDMKL